ncbi:MAG: hypothetical protein HZA51_13510 [Planctomycetes bacterium]|nr:hypothetical protein [Planctomycetota bacterium]
MNLNRQTVVLAILYMLTGAPAGADVIVEQLPILTGGFASDTDFIDMLGRRLWQREADNILLTQDATVRRITWWGFYGGSGTPATPPPATETIQIRIMGARAGDGLPDESVVLMDETFFNPSRMPTGRIIGVGGAPIEQRFTVDLTVPVNLQSNIPYWLEIVQLGDVNTMFRWEDGSGLLTGHSFSNPLTNGWLLSGGSLSFQLSAIPEPTAFTGVLVCITALMRPNCRPRR